MEMHQVRYFIAAAEAESFTRAAEACHVSQPALTTAIRKLEETLGGALFHREGRGLVLSEFGRRMLPHLQRIMDQASLAEGVAENFRLLNQEPVRLGVMSSIGPSRIAKTLQRFGEACPEADLAVQVGTVPELRRRLQDDELDAVIVNPVEGFDAGFRSELLYRERYVVLLPPGHPFRNRNALALEDLSGQPYVDRLSCEMREMVTRTCESEGVTLYAKFRSEREDWVQAMVLAGIGFAFVPEYSVVTSEAIQRPLVKPALERPICLVTMRGRRFSPTAASFVRIALAHNRAAAAAAA